VSGTVNVPPFVATCPHVIYQVSGSISQTFGSATTSGTTRITWSATSPSPSGSCAGSTPWPSVTHTGTITNDGCDSGNGTWSNSGGGNGTFTMSKPADVPDGSPAETTTPIAWWSSDPTIALYDNTIGSSKYMAGRQVVESANGASSDTCWFNGSIYTTASLGSTLAGWFVGFYYFNNRYEYDYVGMYSGAVSYYRSNGRTPCLVTFPLRIQKAALERPDASRDVVSN